MKRVLTAVTAGLVMVCLVSGATFATGGNSDKAKLCQKGGYLTLSGTGGPFATEDACVSYAAEGGVLDLPVGIVLPDSWGPQRAAVRHALGAAGYTGRFESSHDVATEKAAVEALIGRGIKVLILAPWDSTAAGEVANEARDAGVKVVAYDRLILDTASVDYYVSFDLLAVGAAQAQFLVDKAGGSTGNSLYLYAGGAFDSNSSLFFEGAWEKLQPRFADGTFVIENSTRALALSDNPTLTPGQQAAVIAQVDTQWSWSVARALALGNVAAAPPAHGTAFILAPNDETAGAISDAFAANDVATSYVTGQDANQPWVQRLIDGTQGMTVFKDHRTLAKHAVAGAVAFLTHRTPVATTTVDNGTVDVPSTITAPVPVTIDNLQAALIDTGFYEPSDFTGDWPGRP